MPTDLLARVVVDVWRTTATVWPYLALSVVAAAVLATYGSPARLSAWLHRRTPVAVAAAVGLATATPFCSCGTTAVTLGMVATSAPWAPIVAFMVASPLTSPSELVLSAGLLGWPFALVFFVGTVALGLAAGAVTAAIERTGRLRGQARAAAAAEHTRLPLATPAALSHGPGAAAVTEVGSLRQRLQLHRLARETVAAGRRLGPLFLGFTAASYLLVELIPTAWLQGALGGDRPFAVLWAALLGIPMYVNTEGSLPFVAGLVEGGLGPGPAMAFLVTGAGTSIGAITGTLVIARRRVVALTVAMLVVGAIVLGLLAQLMLG